MASNASGPSECPYMQTFRIKLAEMAKKSSSPLNPHLSTLWAARLSHGTSVSFTGLRDIMRILKKQGLDMPSKRAFVHNFRQIDGARSEVKEFTRMVWDPLVAFLDTAAESDSAQLSEALRQNLKAIELELEGAMSGSLDDITIDE